MLRPSANVKIADESPEGRLAMLESSSIGERIRLARRDRSALGHLLEHYRGFLKIVAERTLDSRLAARCDASDVVQQTLARAFESFDRFRGATEPELSAWIKRIHERQLADVARRNKARKRSVSHEIQAGDGSASFCWWEPTAKQSTPSQQLIRGEKALRLAALLADLPKAQRDAVCLRHLEGWSIEQIAAELNRSLPATAGLLKRGLQALRGKMREPSWLGPGI
jgi:RNA polymerase sigma-70 factor, ECF subfamily